MTNIKYTQKQIEELKKNQYVEKCSELYITFTNKIKYESVVLWETGLTCKEVFKKLQFPEYIINSDLPSKNINRLNRTINEKGKDSFDKSKKGRKKDYKNIDINNMTKYEIDDYYKIRIKYLEEENKLLKGIKKKLTKSQRFSIILKIYQKNNLSFLCNLADVSVSGFYTYKNRVKNYNTKIDRDKNDYEIIKEIVLKGKRKGGYRTITMKLYNTGRKMNHKKVYRIMKEYDLLSIVRKRNPYRLIGKRTQEHRTCKNILNRDFRGIEVFKKLGTDISYLHYNGTRAYISILKDMISGEVVSHKVSTNLGLGFVINTIDEAKNNFNLKGSIIQSDQGFHYTHPGYINLLKNNGIIQSMSRKGNCLDNSPTESFFGHMKDEIDLNNIKSYKELVKHINNYIFYYNNNRPQWTRKKMTPVDYRNHLLSQIN